MNREIRCDTELLDTVYRSVAVGAGAITDLIGSADDMRFRSAMEEQLDIYRSVGSEALLRMKRMDARPSSTYGMAKLMSRAGTKLNLAKDRARSHMAEMLIQGSAMGIADLAGALDKNPGASAESRKFCAGYIMREQANINRMKEFLS